MCARRDLTLSTINSIRRALDPMAIATTGNLVRKEECGRASELFTSA